VEAVAIKQICKPQFELYKRAREVLWLFEKRTNRRDPVFWAYSAERNKREDLVNERFQSFL